MPKVPYSGKQVEADEIEFKTRKEEWNEYQLMDGSILKLKSVMASIFRVRGEFDAEGNPIYVTRSQNVASINAPDELKKKI